MEESVLESQVDQLLTNLTSEINDIKDDFNFIIPYLRNKEKGINKTIQQNLYNSFFKTEMAPYCTEFGQDRIIKDDIDKEINNRLKDDQKGSKLIKKWDIYQEKIKQGGRMKEFIDSLMKSQILTKNQHPRDPLNKPVFQKFLAKATKRLVSLFVYIRLQSDVSINNIQELYDLIFKTNFLKRKKKDPNAIVTKQPKGDHSHSSQKDPSNIQSKHIKSKEDSHNTKLNQYNAQENYYLNNNEEQGNLFYQNELNSYSQSQDPSSKLEDLNMQMEFMDLQSDKGSESNFLEQFDFSGNYYSNSFSQSYSNSSQQENNFVDRFFNIGDNNNNNNNKAQSDHSENEDVEDVEIDV